MSVARPICTITREFAWQPLTSVELSVTVQEDQIRSEIQQDSLQHFGREVTTAYLHVQ